MDTRSAYDQWSSQYDTNENKTRDLEAAALRECLSGKNFDNCLEIGCGTGKNTTFLVDKARHITAIDLSEEMMQIAKKKPGTQKVSFRQADITRKWDFGDEQYDLVSFSLVLEHIEDLDHIFAQASRAMITGGWIYIGELHPFKQYSGSKARFETAEGVQVVKCFNHHVSEFFTTGKKYGFALMDIREYFDDGDHNAVPRILALVFHKIK